MHGQALDTSPWTESYTTATSMEPSASDNLPVVDEGALTERAGASEQISPVDISALNSKAEDQVPGEPIEVERTENSRLSEETRTMEQLDDVVSHEDITVSEAAAPGTDTYFAHDSAIRLAAACFHFLSSLKSVRIHFISASMWSM